MGGKRKIRRSRFFRITRSGWMFLLLIIVIAGVGVLKGLNLIYLVASLMISFMFLSSLLSRIGLHRLSLDRVPPRHVFAGKPFPVEVQITNSKRRFSSYSLTVCDIMEKVRLAERYMIRIPAKTTLSATYEHTIDKRGRYEFDGIRVSTLYPLDFFERGFIERNGNALIVYPRIVRLSPNFLADLMSEVEVRLNRPGVGIEVYGFRRYQPGDDSRDINWKLTAKTSEVTVTKFSQDQNLNIAAVFDNCTGTDLPDKDDGEAAGKFESAVTFVASISSFFIEKGYKLKLVTQNGETGFGEGAKHLFSILQHLALIQPMPESKVTKDIYHPSVIEHQLGILITCSSTPRSASHFMHTFHAHRISGL